MLVRYHVGAIDGPLGARDQSSGRPAMDTGRRDGAIDLANRNPGAVMGFVAGLILFRHRGNIARLRAHTERALATPRNPMRPSGDA